MDVEHIIRPDGWESLDMVLRYNRSVKFEDSLKLYQKLDLEANVKASQIDNLNRRKQDD